MRVLITGASGFAGGYLAEACAAAGDEVTGISRTGAIGGAGRGGDAGAVELRALDLCDGGAVREAVQSLAPEVVYHLAALSSVGRSWQEPAKTVQVNVGSAVHLLEALRLEAPSARVVWVSSCEVYGSPASLPVREEAPLAPASPYAVSKAAGEQLAAVYAQAYSMNVVLARPFSHTGPGQRDIFIVGSLTRQAAEARLAGAAELQVVTGNPDTRRDFTDVRDVVRAYRLLGDPASGASGAYNVSSGRSVSAAEQVALLGEALDPIQIEHVVDPARVRAHEVMDLAGSPARLREATGWEPRISLRQTINDSIGWWEQRLQR